MDVQIQKQIFRLCCLALLVTSMTFAIRAGILGQLGNDFGLTDLQLGWVNSMAFLGFPLATIFGGALYNAIGAKKLISLAFACHLLGLVLTITAGGFWGLLVSTFLIGFANGAVEAGCNPLISESYPKNKTTMLNRFHVWFPAGIVIGALFSNFMTQAGFGWQAQVAVIIIPTLAYGYLLINTAFPLFDKKQYSTLQNIKYLASPLFIFLAICMTLTATSELGTQQWIERILGSSGASPMLILALITGLMAIGRFYAGPLINKLNPIGVLFFSSILATIGIVLMSNVQGNMVYVAAVFFALGVTYFWPTMLGCVAEYLPQTGALGMSLIGGIGMFAVSLWNPVIGHWIDSARTQAQTLQLSVAEAELQAGQSVLSNLALFPTALIFCFAGLYFCYRGKNKNVQETTSKIEQFDS